MAVPKKPTNMFSKRIRLNSFRALLLGVSERESGLASQLYETNGGGAANIIFSNEAAYGEFKEKLTQAIKDDRITLDDFRFIDE